MLTDEDWVIVRDLESRNNHRYETRDDGLTSCLVCGGGEGAMPTHCPGVRMNLLCDELATAVYKGLVDYRDGNWVNQPTTAMCHAYGVRRLPVKPIDPRFPFFPIGESDDE